MWWKDAAKMVSLVLVLQVLMGLFGLFVWFVCWCCSTEGVNGFLFNRDAICRSPFFVSSPTCSEGTVVGGGLAKSVTIS